MSNYAFGINHSAGCKALNGWNEIEPDSCNCGVRSYWDETGRCSDHEVLMTDEGVCFLCKDAWDTWINRRKPVMRGA